MNKYKYNEELNKVKDNIKSVHGWRFNINDLNSYTVDEVKKVTSIYYGFKNEAKKTFRKTFVISSIILVLIMLFSGEIDLEAIPMLFVMAIIFSSIPYGLTIKDVIKPPRKFIKITNRHSSQKGKAYFGFSAGIVIFVLSMAFYMDGVSSLTPYSVSVDGYTRSDGTQVDEYNRRPPGSVKKDQQYVPQQAIGILGAIVGGFIVFFSSSNLLNE